MLHHTKIDSLKSLTLGSLKMQIKSLVTITDCKILKIIIKIIKTKVDYCSTTKCSMYKR